MLLEFQWISLLEKKILGFFEKCPQDALAHGLEQVLYALRARQEHWIYWTIFGARPCAAQAHGEHSSSGSNLHWAPFKSFQRIFCTGFECVEYQHQWMGIDNIGVPYRRWGPLQNPKHGLKTMGEKPVKTSTKSQTWVKNQHRPLQNPKHGWKTSESLYKIPNMGEKPVKASTKSQTWETSEDLYKIPNMGEKPVKASTKSQRWVKNQWRPLQNPKHGWKTSEGLYKIPNMGEKPVKASTKSQTLVKNQHRPLQNPKHGFWKK